MGSIGSLLGSLALQEGGNGSVDIFTIFLLVIALIVLYTPFLIWIYRDANSRDMKGIFWALIIFVMLFAGFVGYIVYMKKREKFSVEEAMQKRLPPPQLYSTKTNLPQDVRFCSRCGGRVMIDVEACPKCGNKNLLKR